MSGQPEQDSLAPRTENTTLLLHWPLLHWPRGVVPEQDHVEALARLEASAFPHPWSSRQLRDTLEQPSSTTFALLSRQAGANSKAEAYACFQYLVDEVELLRLAVAPRLRRRGLGASLLRTALGHLHRQLGDAGPPRACLLEVAADNSGAIALYEEMGFRLEGRRRGYYRSIDGAPVDALLYRYFFSPERP